MVWSSMTPNLDMISFIISSSFPFSVLESLLAPLDVPCELLAVRLDPLESWLAVLKVLDASWDDKAIRHSRGF